MTYRQALQSFFESFGINVYPEDNADDIGKDTEDVKVFPWITYPQERGGFDEVTEIVAHLHYYTESSAKPNAKADEICDAIGNGLRLICDEGAIVLTTNSPKWQATPDETDRLHKHRLINISTHWFLTK